MIFSRLLWLTRLLSVWRYCRVLRRVWRRLRRERPLLMPRRVMRRLAHSHHRIYPRQQSPCRLQTLQILMQAMLIPWAVLMMRAVLMRTAPSCYR